MTYSESRSLLGNNTGRNPEDRLVGNPDFKGPVDKRGCTDVLCTLLIVAMWVGMSVLGQYSVANGDYRLVVNPIDYSGNICGVDNRNRNAKKDTGSPTENFNMSNNPYFNMSDNPYLSYANKFLGKQPPKYIDMSDYPYLVYVNGFLGGVCVKECPDLNKNGTSSLSSVDFETLITFGGVFQSKYRGSNNSSTTAEALQGADAIVVADYPASSELRKTCTMDSCYPGVTADTTNITQVADQAFKSLTGVASGFGYAMFALDTFSFLNRCLPTADALDEMKEAVVFVDKFEEALEHFGFFQNVYGEVYVARNWVLGFGLPGALVLGFLYLVLLRIPLLLSGLVWGSILLTNALFYGLGAYSYHLSTTWKEEEPQTRSDDVIRSVAIVAYVFGAVGVLFTLFMCCIRKELQLSLGTIKETSKAIQAMPLLTLFPIVQCIGFIAFLVVWVYYGVWIASLGEMKIKTYSISKLSSLTLTSVELEYDQETICMGLYHLFCLFWTYEFILAMGQIIVAMSIAKWYFTRDKSTIGSHTVLSSIVATVVYHTGTAAFGALLLAIISMIRAIIAKIQKEAKKSENKLAECVACCCTCCFWCLDKCIRFMNKNAYIQTAIMGTSFCTSCKEAFFLILRNAMKIGALHYVGLAVAFIGKLFITMATTFSCYALMSQYAGDIVDDPTGPLIVVAILAYLVADIFMSLFEFGISTVLMCFIADDEMYDEGEAFADGALKTMIDDWGK